MAETASSNACEGLPPVTLSESPCKYASMPTREVAAEVAFNLDRENVPNVLWGNLMLTVWGVPSVIDGASFIVPDRSIIAANSILLQAGFQPCLDQETCMASVESRASPAPSAHVHINEDMVVTFYKHSETLPKIKSLETSNNDSLGVSDIIVASSPELPSQRPSRGEGRFPESLYSIRVPTAHRLLEGYVDLILRHRFHTHEFFFTAMFTYMLEFGVDDELLDQTNLNQRYSNLVKEFQIGEKRLPQLLDEMFPAPSNL